MTRLLLLLAIAVLGLSACRDNLSDRFATTPTPTPTPVPGSDEDDTDDEDTTDEDTSEDDSPVDSGAAMSALNERVGIVSIETTEDLDTLLTIQRSNGEVWELELNGTPDSAIGSLAMYQNRNLVFGSTGGIVIFQDGIAIGVEASARIR